MNVSPRKVHCTLGSEKVSGISLVKKPSILCFVFIDTEVQVSQSHTTEITFCELTNNKAYLTVLVTFNAMQQTT